MPAKSQRLKAKSLPLPYCSAKPLSLQKNTHMEHMTPSIEIMAPAGSYEALTAAIQGGANSVYFGVGKLNMRARSSQNFSIDDLHSIVSICREKGVRTYLTLNTIIYDGEMEEMRLIVDNAAQAGITAIIASDISVMEYARSKGVEIHISTQCNITNLEALRFYARYADVVVTARELSLEQVRHIVQGIERENIKGPSGNLVQVEMFVHGALCMAVSGKCYLSLDNMNHSANRGSCLQLCRRSYVVRDKEEDFEMEIDNEYIMSPKDLCTIGFVDKIIRAGVRVFKIEGRGRGAGLCQNGNSLLPGGSRCGHCRQLYQRESRSLDQTAGRGI
jgi:U32 family peptidase